MKVLLATTSTPDDRKTVSCARSLARAGASVTVGGDEFWGQAFYTRSVSGRIRYPHPRAGIQPFIEAINEHSGSSGCDVVLPMNDYTTLALTRHRDALPTGLATALPSIEASEIAGDKLRTQELARRLGIEAPDTWEIANKESLHQLADRIDYPCVVKLRRGSGAVGFQIIPDRQVLTAAYTAPREASDLAFDRDHLLVQEYVPGEVHDACVLCRHGEIRAAFTQRRIRTYPRQGGIGTLLESTREPGLLERAQRILAELEWHGPAQVEFKIDPQTGHIRLIEINGRFWGALDVPVRAGVDFPLLTCRLALEGDVAPVFDYEVGLLYRFPFPFGLFALGDRETRGRAARDFFAPRRATRSDLRWTDPLPVVAEFLFIARRAWRRRSLRPAKERL